MGLLKRLRASSSAHARPELEAAPPLPHPPTAPLYASSSRASFTGSEATFTHPPDASASNPTPAKPSKSFWKRKAKGKEREVQGFSYESTAPAFPPVSVDRAQPTSDYQPRPQGGPDRTRNELEDGLPTPRSDGWDEAGLETPRPPQHAPKGILKTRGMLGKLDFETEDSPTEQDRMASTGIIPPHRHSSYSPFSARRPNGPDRSITTANYGDLASGPRESQARDIPPPRMSHEEPVERLISPEKKKVWTPAGRRMSVSSDSAEPSSPTPRKGSLPPQDIGTPMTTTANKVPSSGSHEVPAHSTRRPSSSRRSSFIPLGNPFARSTTRLSLSNDPNADDGSFQLRSFRHVSGASEADFAGWETYNQPEVPKADSTALSPGDLASPVNGTASPSRSGSTAPPSRPVSRATSLASMDDHIAASTKVTAAAFRKGIRRPSESAMTSMDTDDDDDVPLGMLRPGARQSSVMSLSSMRDGTKTPGSNIGASSPVRSPIRQAPNLSPVLPLPVTPSKVKSSPMPSPAAEPPDRLRPRVTRSRTQPLISPDEIHPIFASPSGSPTGEKSKGLPQEDYFASAKIPVGSETSQKEETSPAFDFKSLDYPIDAISTSPEAPELIKTELTPVLEPPVDISPRASRPGKLSISVPEPKEPKTSKVSIVANEDNHGDMDPEMIVKSMAIYGSAEEAEEPATPRVALHQQSHSTLFGTDASSDTTSTVRSPLSERLGNLVVGGPRPMSSKPSLPKLDTLRLDGSEKVKSPVSDSTASPTVSTIRDPQAAVSSFARVRPPSPDESESESEEEEEQEEEEAVVPPKRHDGPPRSSFTNAPRPRIPPPNKACANRQSADIAKTSSSSCSDSEDDDKPLARIKSKASRSTLAAGAQDRVSAPKFAKTVTAPLPVIDHSRSASAPITSSIPTSTSIGPTLTSPTKRVWNASPASSQSGLTGDSSAVQPITPSENDMPDGRYPKTAPTTDSGQWSDSKRASVSWAPEQRSRRDSHISAATAPPTSANHMHEQAPPLPPMPAGVDPMDPMTRQKMKEIWQAQYMAAASRAFEDEWERQSNVSGATGSVAPSFHQHSQYAGYPMPQPQSPYGYGQYPSPPQMGYGFPPQMPPSQYMYPNYPNWNMPSPQPEPSMYSYGAGTQSVYGGEFGPPQHMPMSPYNRPMSMGMGLPQSYSSVNLHQPQPSQRPSMPTSRSTSYFHPPASSSHSGRRERAPADDLDYTPPPKGLIHSVPNSPRGNRRSQLGTSVINANDRSHSSGPPPPTSWRRSSMMPLLNWDETETTSRKKRPVGQIVN